VSGESIHVVFAEEDTLFRLMEVALRRAPTLEGEKTLHYFFGDDIAAPLRSLTTLADRLGLPRDITTAVCQSEAELDDALPAADFVVVEATKLDEARVAACAARVRLIQQFGRSYRNIDVAAARRLAVPVANLVRLSSLSCADHITALILALARRLVPAHREVIARRDPDKPAVFAHDAARNKFNWANVRKFQILAHSTIGLVGLGENSGLVARRMRDFGMRVLYFKRTPLGPEDEASFGGITFAPLDRLLAESDFVSLHLPYGAATEKFADHAFFSQMKRGAYLINSARGGVVDDRALYDALRNGRLAGAALDVYRYEPVPADSPLLDLDNVLWTPHIAGGEPEYMLVEVEAVLSNIGRALNGEPLSDLVMDSGS
jgi:phosphoglycerate dehydrogenase-like enzyme